jgi:formate dehydrogenase subunit delta
MKTQDMVRMANQISDYFKSYSEKEALDGIAEHISKFWEPRMRKDFFAHLEKGGDGFSELVKKAAVLVKKPIFKA